MFLRLKAYHRPRDLAEALGLLSAPRARLLAGGTAVVGPTDEETETLVDLSGLGLHYIRPAGPAVAVGAMATLSDLFKHSALRTPGAGLLSEVIRLSAPVTLLNRATVGGALAHPERAGELCAALLALDARVLTLRLGNAGSVVREGWEFESYLRHRLQILRSGIVEEVQIPTMPVAAAMERVARTPRDLPVVSVVAVVEGSGAFCDAARVGVSGLSFRPERLEAVESALTNAPLTDDQIARAAAIAADTVYPPSDFRGDADYRQHLAGVLVRRALEKARTIAETLRKE